MTYSIPELLLVGAAQNLVLGSGNSFLPIHEPNCIPDNPVPGTSDLISEW